VPTWARYALGVRGFYKIVEPRLSRGWSLAVAVLVALTFATTWLALPSVLRDVPPLRTVSLLLIGFGAAELVELTTLCRRARQAHAECRFDLASLVVGVIEGIVFVAIPVGIQSVAFTQLPLLVIMIAALSAPAWHFLLGTPLSSVRSIIASLLAGLAIVLIVISDDSAPGSILALLLFAALFRTRGMRLWSSERESTISQEGVYALVSAGVTLQVAGILRGENWHVPDPTSAISLLGLLCVVVVGRLSMIKVDDSRPEIVNRASALTLVAVAAAGELLFDRHSETATWIAAMLVFVATLLHPPELRDGAPYSAQP
jgi:hypothetical protein